MTHPTIEPYPHQVEVFRDGILLARTRRGLLHRHSYAPDIYIPAEDIVVPLRTDPAEPHRFGLDQPRVESIARSAPGHAAFKGHITFDFTKITLVVDGSQVRGHVRDPYKVITVTPVLGRLQMSLDAADVVDSTAALELRETGLPARFYVPATDVNAAHLEPSDRQTVCTYKGEATYHHLRTPNGRKDNVIWCYAAPWTDFASDIGRIAGHYGLYASAFDRVLLDGRTHHSAAAEAKADQAMIATPTVDAVLQDKLSS